MVVANADEYPGAQLAGAERISSWTTSNKTAGAAAGVIPGLQTATIVGEGRAVDIVFNGLVQHASAGGYIAAYLMCNGSYTSFPAGQLASVFQGATGSARTINLRRTPVLVSGQSYSFQVGLYGGSEIGSVTLAAAANYPAELTVTRR